MKLTVYPVAHGASGYAIGHHPKTLDLASGISGKLRGGGGDSSRDASPTVSDVRDIYTPFHFWRDCLDFHWRQYCALLRSAENLRVVAG